MFCLIFSLQLYVCFEGLFGQKYTVVVKGINLDYYHETYLLKN